MNKTIQEQLNEWADRTVCAYKRIINESNIDAAFYTQTPLDQITESPELIVMGINPGSTGSYHRQIEEGTVIDGKYLLKGNPCWEEHKKWGYWNRCIDVLRKAFPNCDKDNQCIFTNATFMGTLKANEISGCMFDAFLRTMELIDILEPKYVICLSGRECFKRIKNSGKQFKYISLSDRVLVGRMDKIVYIGIPHPSAHLSNEERSYIQNVILFIKKNSNHSLQEIESLVENEPNLREVNTPVDYESGICIVKNVAEWLKDNVHIECYESKDESVVRYKLGKGIQISIVALRGEQYVGYRHLDKKINHYKAESVVIPTALKDFNLRNHFYIHDVYDSWMGQKNMRDFGHNTAERIRNIILSVIELKVTIDSFDTEL